MQPTPIWFLDIDGVINALRDKRSPRHAEYEVTEVTVYDAGIVARYPIHYRPAVVDLINRVHRDGLAEVRWLTTWGWHARTTFAPAVGLDGFTVAAEPPLAGPTRAPWSPDWWKLAVIREQASDRFVFTDDDARRPSRKTLRSLPGESLVITPLKTIGLDDAHLNRIVAFLTAETRPDTAEEPTP